MPPDRLLWWPLPCSSEPRAGLGLIRNRGLRTQPQQSQHLQRLWPALELMGTQRLHHQLAGEQLQQITAEYFGRGDKEYEALGITKEATDDEVYRRCLDQVFTRGRDRRALGCAATLGELGYAAQAVEQLRADGVI